MRYPEPFRIHETDFYFLGRLNVSVGRRKVGRFLLATDMDGTVIPTEPGEGRLGETREFAAAIRSRPEIVVAYITGRSLALSLEAIETFQLPAPEFLACDVGTTVYRHNKEEYQLDSEYRALMLEARGGVAGDSIRTDLASVSDLRLQEDAKQAEFKVSYYFPAGTRGDEVLAEVRRRLSQGPHGARVTLVSSRETGTGRGLLDVLPAKVAKETAVRYLHRLTGIDGESVVVAGDSGNDRSVLTSGYRAIVVGNAPESLKAELRQFTADHQPLADHVYFARNPFAAGVLEGCRHFGLL